MIQEIFSDYFPLISHGVIREFDLYDRFNAFSDKKFIKTPKNKINLKEKEQ